LPPKPQSLVLNQGDILILTRSLKPGPPAGVAGKNKAAGRARIGVTLPEFFDCVRPGDPVWLDDSMIGGTVSMVAPDQVGLETTHTRAGGDKLAPRRASTSRCPI